ncbi:hypothetical protein [Roseibium sp.]|uniref:hypothetical protein n=1 Tax=Roseibium sp. TaxID=1936156 RepID=UPI00343EECE3
MNVRIPKVRSKTGKPITFRSALVPPYVRKARSIEATFPCLYLEGISAGETGAVLRALLGPGVAGSSTKPFRD